MSDETTAVKPLAQVAVGNVARLRKAHPCGGRDWTVTRIGAEIGLECRTCGRKVLLSRVEFERRCATITPSSPSPQSTPA